MIHMRFSLVSEFSTCERMKYLIDLPAELFTRIQAQLGEHQNLQGFFLLAAENQLGLEKGELEPSDHRPAQVRAVQPASPPELFRRPEGVAVSTSPPVAAEHMADIRDVSGVPWIWGQVNRVFPLKCLVRAVLSIAATPVALEDLAAELAEPCRELGMFLLRIDEQKESRRDERLSVGFPTGPRKDAALNRFLGLFLGEVRQDGRVSGALFSLGLMGVDPSGLVGLTSRGVHFAGLTNPLLDAGQVVDVLSDEERTAYVEQVLRFCPGEVTAFSMIASALREGRSSNSLIEEVLAAGPGSHWTPAVVSTQRSGAMGRMLDLGLMLRKRHGRRVEFELTRAGSEFLTKVGRVTHEPSE